MNCRLLLADDHALIRVGVRAMVDELPGFEIVGEAEDGQEVVEQARQLKPDIILLDISMKDVSGLEALRPLAQVAPASKVLMLSMHSEAGVVLDALRRGAQGYLLKDAAMAELHLALRAIGRGERYLSSAIAQPVIEQALAHEPPPSDHGLTQRQIEILRLITRGTPTRAIAEGLGLSVKTVEAHRAQIMKRLDIHDVPGLVLYALREGIIHADD
ncbi:MULTISPECIES: response regulator transcription factor [unclassified Pseudomonas]|uniref:response regulator transcription factor n=1 Tax=unclassified Pseudomonas TaxID=196821 RepID=UPI00244C2B39|nr:MULTISPECIES: response regulator transcription factor [unclassified Pseudomonas]MDG9929971.1 response regulator transcription factor [Pseudomonas sp. GD04042]MDH0483201.1 response regulator transcription factor [Pseudomonas sp. GD04015]MDH0606338.1 response regulator transcription factor [Pseudomonas sp. GD03869]